MHPRCTIHDTHDIPTSLSWGGHYNTQSIALCLSCVGPPCHLLTGSFGPLSVLVCLEAGVEMGLEHQVLIRVTPVERGGQSGIVEESDLLQGRGRITGNFHTPALDKDHGPKGEAGFHPPV